MVEPDHSLPLLCKGLEDQPESLPQPGPGNGLARQITNMMNGCFTGRNCCGGKIYDTVEALDPATVVFRLKFATNAFLPALADPYSWIYKKGILDKDPRWYEKYILGSGPFRFVDYQVGQAIKGIKNPDYYHKGLPHL